MAARQRLRVIAWGTGAVGSEMVTTILDHRADLDIVGARVYSPAKAGTDIGALVGRDPIGVTATTDVDRILALEADCVLYTPHNASIDEVCAILSSGKNVATTAFLFHPRRISRVATAMQVLNAVPAICAAPPGFATTASLPLIHSHTGFNNLPPGGQ